MVRIFLLLAVILTALPALAFSPANSPVTSVASSAATGAATVATPAPSGDGSLADVIDSAVFDLDATVADSYPGTGTTWANLIAAPADGAAQDAYDFYTGDGSTSTTYPTFNGTAGDSAAYWSFDGGDYNDLKSGVNTAFFNTLHQSGSDWWIAVTLRPANVSTFQRIISTRDTSANGVSFSLSNAGGIHFIVERNTTTTSTAQAGSALSIGSDYLLLFTFDGSAVNFKYSVNSATLTEVDIANAGADADADDVLRIGAASNNPSALPLLNGTFMYSIAMGNEYLDDTKAAAIIAHLEARHGRDYTP